MKFLYDNFDLLFDEAGSVDAFKKLILDMAVRGKLVPQDPSDEPASFLVEKITNQKDSLIEEGLIKKEKPMPPIKEIETPYVLPNGWEWVRLKELGLTQTGTTPPTNINEYYNGDVPFIKPADISQDGINYSNESLSNIGAIKGRIIQKDSVMMVCIGGSIGKTFFIDRDASCNQQINTITGFNDVSGKFINYFISASYFQQNIVKNASGSATPIINKEKWGNLLFPLPPINEQKRIVKKIDEIYEMIPQLKEAFEKRTKYKRQLNQTSLYRLANASSGDDFVSSMQFVTNNFDSLYDNIENVKELRQVILTLAVQGKLAPQDPNDEPASVLLEKIQKGKKWLISEGQLKKEKPLPPIKQDEVPYNLPGGWEWVRVGEITQLSPRNTLDDDLDVAFVPMTLIKDGFANSHNFERRSWKEIKSGFTHFMEDDVVVAKITPCFQNRKSAVMKNLPNYYGSGTTELHVFRPYGKLIIPYFLLSIFKTDRFIQSGISTYTGTAGQQRIKKDFCRNFVVGIPPLNEQKNIVEKIDRLMAFCDDLENDLIGFEDAYKLLLKTVISETILNAS